MRIWVVMSWYEMIPMIQVLQQYNHTYHIFVDWAYWPWLHKSFALQKERALFAMHSLEEKVDAFIVPPSIELALLKTWNTIKPILPIFQTYITQHVLPYSLVGKLWLLCSHTHMYDTDCSTLLDGYLHTVATSHELTKNQSFISSFHTSFPFWKKDVAMWMYFLWQYGNRHWMVRKTIKHDLRYFFDAWVDTLVPMDWWFLSYESVLSSRTKRKKIRFHGKNALTEVCQQYVDTAHDHTYALRAYTTDTQCPLSREKKYQLLLSKWWTCLVQWQYLTE